MSRISIYVNKKASNSHDKFLKGLKNHLFRHETTIKQPKSIEELHEELGEDLRKDVEYIFAIGGDGTINTILQKIANTSINLLIIPAGAANDLATEVGMDHTIKKIMKVFQHKTYSQIDLIRVNGRYMATNGGV
ncbi:MAG: diacylglycerol kinase family protein, partial [Bacteriovoracaceae bacterium]